MILTRALSNKRMTSVIVSSGKFARSFRLVSHASLLAMAVACLVALPAAPPSVHAGTINYGDFNVPPAGIMFQQVREFSGTDPVPLYGPPTPFMVGLDFDPTFVSSATGGASDITDGQLNFTIMGLSNPNGYIGIGSFNVLESGDYTLKGTGTAATSASAGAIVRATVTQVNGMPVPPINLPPANPSVGFDLAANPGIVQPWSLGLGYNLLGVLPQGQVATKVEVVINNSLISISEPASVAFIAKKDFRIDVVPTPPVGDPFVPEPASLALVCLGGIMTTFGRKVRR